MPEVEGLICAYELKSDGTSGAIGWPEVERHSSTETEELVWIHLDYKHPNSLRWLREESGLQPETLAAFAAEDTRPRSAVTADGLLVILRGVNLNPGAEPDDMVSVRMLLCPGRIITLRHRPLKAISDLIQAIESGQGPVSAASFMTRMAYYIVQRMSDVMANLDDLVDELEDSVLTLESRELRPKLADLRRQIIRLRRYLAPQRDMLTQLQYERIELIEEIDRIHLRELADRTTRYVEDLDAARDRAAVTQEELSSLLAERMDKTMYVLSLVAAVFLPLGLITGLLGINVGGMPGAEDAAAFWWVCVLLVVLGLGQVWYFKRKRWF